MDSPRDLTDPDRPRRNIEIKARVADLDHAREVARRLATDHLGVLQQTDTYFHCPSGRLKLREIEGQPAELIAYARPDQAGPKTSDYHLVVAADPAGLLRALSSTLGVRIVVKKRREVFLVDNVRIHLDEVYGLGSFLELEAVVGEEVDEKRAHEQISGLLEALRIDGSDLLDSSYGDMLGA
jgi:adenylate cyclase class 2